MKNNKYGHPRRINYETMTPEEFEIRECIQSVEMLGAHELLTDCIVKLVEAKDKLGDWVDQQSDEYIEASARMADWVDYKNRPIEEIEAELKAAGIDTDKFAEQTNTVLRLCKERLALQAENEKLRELVNPILDAYCRYFLADDGSQAEELARNQLEMGIATAAIDLRGEAFLKDFEVVEARSKAALDGKGGE